MPSCYLTSPRESRLPSSIDISLSGPVLRDKRRKNTGIDQYSVSYDEVSILEEMWMIAYTGIENKYNDVDEKTVRFNPKVRVTKKYDQ